MEYNSASAESHQWPAYSDSGLPESALCHAASSPDAFRTTVELSASGICHIDTDGRLLYVNPALCQITGYSRDEMLSLTIQDIVHPDDIAETLEDFRRLISGEVPVLRMERRYRRRDDGSLIWVALNATLRHTPSGAPQYAIALIEDIGERKQLEEQLRATNQQLALAGQESQQQAQELEATFEAITDLIVVFDTAGNIRRVNKAVRDFAPPQPTVESGRRYLGLADMQGHPLPHEQLASSRVLRGETFTGDQAIDMLANTDGRESQFNVSGAPVRDAGGQIVGGVIVLRDVTKRRKLERRTQEALQALLQMAEALVAPIPGPALISQLGDGTAASHLLNPVAQRLAELAARVLGCRRVGIVSLGAGHDIMHPVALIGVPPEQVATWCAGLEGGSISAYIGADSMRKLRAGETTQIDLERQPLRSVAHGGPVALAVPLRLGDQLVGSMALGYEQEPHTYTEDELALAAAVGQLAAMVIERERLQQEREKAHASALAMQVANRRMEEFLGIASHELKTPLASLLGNVQLLQRRLARTTTADKTAEDLTSQLHIDALMEEMDRQGKRLSRLVGDLVNTSRIQAGDLDFHMQTCDLVPIVREMVEEQRQAQPERTITLALPEDTPVPVVADADRIGQVITNYLTNALKYSQENFPVQVRLRVTGDTARLSVRDEGPGLPVEEQSRIWGLFLRAPDIHVQSGSGIGLGLGLHISKTIIERHGGHVGVESAVGQGSTFWFTLPLAAPSQAAPTAPSTTPPSTVE